MTIHDVETQLEQSKHPVAKVLHKGDHFKVFIIGFKAGMILKEHQTMWPAKLTVLRGKVIYKEADREVIANTYDEVDIPVATLHNVQALEDSLCLLTQG
ncbi:MAG: hypothetical protein V4651_03090 [Bacteroidota bacterium]